MKVQKAVQTGYRSLAGPNESGLITFIYKSLISQVFQCVGLSKDTGLPMLFQEVSVSRACEHHLRDCFNLATVGPEGARNVDGREKGKLN